jgi:glycosyltransferase involved in cell wall biosynthesis
VSIDHNPALFAKLRPIVSRFTVPIHLVSNDGEHSGASPTRNAGAARAGGEVLAFLDDDALPDPDWLEHLVAPLSRPDVAGVGGFVRPEWEERAPRWYPPEFLWAVGATYRGMPEGPAPVRNVWSENMVLRRKDFLACGGFREGFGKRGNVSRPEDTDLCVRVSRLLGARWFFEPAARVSHIVPAERSTARFLLRRSWAEGRGKATLSLLGTAEELADEKRHALKVIPCGIASGFRHPWADGAQGLRRASITAAGAVAAAAGYGFGRLAATRRAGHLPAVGVRDGSSSPAAGPVEAFPSLQT